MAKLTKLEDIVSLCKRRGFIFQSSEIYGGLASCYDYGPLGVELKNNVKKSWWKQVVQMRDDIVGIDCSILMHPLSGRPPATLTSSLTSSQNVKNVTPAPVSTI